MRALLTPRDTTFIASHFDLVTPDGALSSLQLLSPSSAKGVVLIEGISPAFVGYQVPRDRLCFNFKSLLAQLGLNAVAEGYALDPKRGCAEVHIHLHAIGALAEAMLKELTPGAYVGKLFAADERRRVRNPDYLTRMFGRSDRKGRPLLSLGGLEGSNQLILERVDGQMVAFLSLLEGRVSYASTIYGLLPTIARGLLDPRLPLRPLLALHQVWEPGAPRTAHKGELLLVKTPPLHVRTVFARVVNSLLAPGFQHTTANILQPDTEASGDIYELYGEASRELSDIPLEFFTLEPHREHVFFADRDQLQAALEAPPTLFEAFKTAPEELPAANFIVKGTQLLRLKREDWIAHEVRPQQFPSLPSGVRQMQMVEHYLEQQPSYPFLKAIEEGVITSQGVLFTRYFPSPIMKRLLLSGSVQRCLKAIYFQLPSASYGQFFSQEDRAMLIDLATFGIPVFWVDETSHQLLKYVQRPGHSSGMFVPYNRVATFLQATFWGVYGSNLMEGNFENELKKLLVGILALREEVEHPLLHRGVPLALVTGGGPGAMALGNRMAKELGILSCANIVDFSQRSAMVINEQRQNPFVEAKMTYRLEQVIERQAEFFLDFPIFLMGGIGTDFEFSLEELRRKVGLREASPVILFGAPSYWEAKLTQRYQCNLRAGTIKGSEWLSNSFFCIQHAEQGLAIYRDYFLHKLPIGKEAPPQDAGFVVIDYTNPKK